MSGRKYDPEDSYLIWSNEHHSWWLGGRAGYTRDVHNAGIYSRREALEICSQAIPGWHAHGRPPGFHELPVRLHDVKTMVAESPTPNAV